MRSRIDIDDCKDPVRLARVLNTAFQELFSESNLNRPRIVVSLDVQTPAVVADAFPQIFAGPGFPVAGVIVLRLKNADNSTVLLTSGSAVQWFPTADGRISITNISGLAVNTRYVIDLEVISA